MTAFFVGLGLGMVAGVIWSSLLHSDKEDMKDD